MVASREPLFQSERDLREEINELRRGLLPMFLPLMIGVAWLCLANRVRISRTSTATLRVTTETSFTLPHSQCKAKLA